jgi:hypothetical protein
VRDAYGPNHSAHEKHQPHQPERTCQFTTQFYRDHISIPLVNEDFQEPTSMDYACGNVTDDIYRQKIALLEIFAINSSSQVIGPSFCRSKNQI